ncbi:MAG: GTPase Era [Nitrospiraceae bacterium]|nr:MAG: GTPase Era [Nitrospiraceae bacterium]
MSKTFRSGYVSLIGRPNVGKSTLLNSLLGQKISIITDKPQTTRNRIVGIRTQSDAQIIFIDTPGIHQPAHKLGEVMLETAEKALQDVDLVVFVTDPYQTMEQNAHVIARLQSIHIAVILVISKIDVIRKGALLALIARYKELFPFQEIIPVSAINEDGLDDLIDAIQKCLPVGPQYYPDDIVSDQIERFMVSEIIREKIMEKTSDEIPYSIAVEIMKWDDRQDGIISIQGYIYVEREGQKGIIIGKNGRMLRLIGMKARLDIERLLGTKIFLELWVKVKKNWRNNKMTLHDLGYS